MKDAIKMLLSLLIGVVAMGIAKLVHPSWSITYLLIFGLMVFAVTFLISLLVKKDTNTKEGIKIYRYFGIGFWIGAGVLSLVSMSLNLRHAPQNDILFYTYLMTGISVFGLILNIILLKKTKQKRKRK